MCPLRPQCVAAAPGTGRTVQLHPQEALLQQARALQQSEASGRPRCWARVAGRRQTGIGHQSVVVERDTDAVGVVAW